MSLYVKGYRWGIRKLELILKKITFGHKNLLPDFVYDGYHNLVIKKIRKDLGTLISSYKGVRSIEDENCGTKEIIWVMWWQRGNVPRLVEKNLSILRKKTRKKVVFLNEDNISDFLDIPFDLYENVKCGKKSYAVLSDYVRTAILFQYGGIWLDSTILVVGESPLLSLPVASRDFITIHGVTDYGDKFVAKDKWTVYCIGGRCNQLFFKFVNDGLGQYLSSEYPQPDYFLVDYLFEIAYQENIDGFRTKVNSLSRSEENVERLSRIINEKYDKEEFYKLCKNTHIFKMSNKKDYLVKTSSGEDTFFGHFYGK